jgi:hypothetical protein
MVPRSPTPFSANAFAHCFPCARYAPEEGAQGTHPLHSFRFATLYPALQASAHNTQHIRITDPDLWLHIFARAIRRYSLWRSWAT